jgi:molybdopterin/thiamine biosynthesis adenylyltransferase
MSGVDERFSRHGLVPGWHQGALAEAAVVILGVGALGNVVAQTLALAGVGRLVLCDPDVVSASNLSRTPLFRPDHVGVPKVDAAAATLQELAPALKVEGRAAPFVHGVGLAEMRDAALIMSCLDSRAARVQLAGRCGLVRARWLDAGTSPWGGEIRPYLDPEGPCYGCGFTPAERGATDMPRGCTAPALPLGAHAGVASLVGSWASLLAMRVLMGLTVPSELLVVDGERGTTVRVVQRRDPACPFHEPLEVTLRVALGVAPTVGALMAALREGLGDGVVPLPWQPIMRLLVCRRCGRDEVAWGMPAPRPCAACGDTCQPRTSWRLDGAPPALPLTAAGVAPREILPVKTPSGIVAVELI